MFQNIMIAYDESKEAQHALDSAIALAGCLGAKLTIVTVVESLPGYAHMASFVAIDLPREVMAKRTQQLKNLQESAQKRAAEKGVLAQLILTQGEEVASIIEAASRDRTDLLVFGLRKHNGISLFGSTANNITKHSPCALLAVS